MQGSHRRRGSRQLLKMIVVTTVAMVTATAMSACGGKNHIVVPKNTSTSVKSRRGNDPCRLLKAKDLRDVYGSTFATGAPVAGLEPGCGFQPSGDSSAPPSVTIHIKGEVTFAAFESARLAAPRDTRDVNGVGDQAYYAPETGQLFVRDGVFGFDVGAVPALASAPGGVERLIALAQIVVKRHG
jgi:hypothetical protein